MRSSGRVNFNKRLLSKRLLSVNINKMSKRLKTFTTNRKVVWKNHDAVKTIRLKPYLKLFLLQKLS